MTDFAQRAAKWLHGHDTGLSSEAIFHFMTLGVKGGSTPSDPADLGRCLRLLDAFPEWKPRMWEMKTVSRDWAILMDQWDAIVVSFEAEAGEARRDSWGNWSAPKTYNLMKELFDEKRDGSLHQRAVA